MDPYRELNKEKKLPFNFKMWFKTWMPKFGTVIGVLIAIFVVGLLGRSCYSCNKRQNQNDIVREQRNKFFTSFMETKCSPGFYIEVKNVRDDIFRLTCSLENGKENEIVVKFNYPDDLK